jgi:hypothetical protein
METHGMLYSSVASYLHLFLEGGFKNLSTFSCSSRHRQQASLGIVRPTKCGDNPGKNQIQFILEYKNVKRN